MDRFSIASWFRHLQDLICEALEKADGKGTFREDPWKRPGGGGGKTRILANANIIEKGGVNFSEVHGVLSPDGAAALGVEGHDFFAGGVSVVMHPFSPMVPIIHMNVRYFEVSSGERWFGGGIDLTPVYVDIMQAASFHKHLKALCDRHNPHYYADFKKQADAYFFIRHREETRGVGGIFFDRLGTEKKDPETFWDFIRDTGETFASLYPAIMIENKDIPYGKREKEFQLFRRGRYAEFNLVYDRGTRFGLKTDGRAESILMSLPPLASWKYDYQPEQGSDEAKTMKLLRRDIDWIAMAGPEPA